jgi:hypothetical protein
MLFSQVKPNLVLRPGGERMIYDAGELMGIKFSNYTRAFGTGLPYESSRGSEAILAFYICEHSELHW